ncbi:aminotransferase class I/II-fold pyridoxal phosphate-dependent enzyme [Candidatus Woesearchaeota archaeon]|nr:aminotransferase class I/II-fold pyridoxal phosphate-dependent enzyme [Candidatus Woesearchaeota archaeon]
MNVIPSRRAAGVTYAIRYVERFAQARRAAGKDILNLNIGDPAKYDFDVPAHLKTAVKKALNDKNYYSPSAGLDEARDAVAKHHGVSMQDVFITGGVTEAIQIILNVLLNPQDAVMLPKPTYPLYTAQCMALGLKYVYYPTDDQWQPTVHTVPANAKALVVINPNNPTGAVYSKKILKNIVNIAATNKFVLIADEIYDHMVFEEHTPLAKIVKDEVPLVTLNGLSKNFLAPGWRIGWMALKNMETGLLTDAIQNLLESKLCAPTPFQFAIKPALTGSQKHIPQMVRKLKKRRDYVYKRLNEIPGMSCTKPGGAFYAFPKIPAEDDYNFVRRLCEETGVLCVHGSGFGKPGHMRVVFLPQEKVLEEAMERIEGFVRNLKGR